MPLSREWVASDRADFKSTLSAAEVEALVANRDLRVLQTSSPVEAAAWDRLNETFFPRRSDVQLRVYGFFGEVCDLSFLRRLPNVRRFSADCLMQARGVEHLAALENLESLKIGIHDLESFDFLAHVPTGHLTSLGLQATKSRKPRLNFLERFDQLQSLYLEGQRKDIEVISRLERLEDLTLRSITTDSLDFLAGLDRLWSLDVKLGGISNLSALEGMQGIKYLELWQIRGLADLTFVSSMRGLQFLFLQSLSNVRRLPDLSQLKGLRRIYLENMRGLDDFSALTSAPALQEFLYVSAIGREPEQFRELLQLKSLKSACVGFGSARKNAAFLRMLDDAGVQEFGRSDFSFA